MTTTQAIGPYECHNAYRELHTGPVGREWMAFLAECNNPQSGDGAARSAGIPPTVVAASPNAQPAPPPRTEVCDEANDHSPVG